MSDSDLFHILITKETGKGHSFVISRRSALFGSAAVLVILLSCTVMGIVGLQWNMTHLDLTTRIETTKKQIRKLTSRLNESYAAKEAISSKLHELKMQSSEQSDAFQLEKQNILENAVSELEERSDMIERIMSSIGVDPKDLSGPSASNSGGPFIENEDDIGKDLLKKADTYLETIKSIPLGKPVPGQISSRFGRRNDPVNGKGAFHTGVDLRGKTGDKILATADGVVTKAFFNGGYGRYIEISHGHGYTTHFAHLRKMKVKKGDKVTRGQVIGTVGNSGRSTGSHLHYEICLNSNPINPAKFMSSEKLRHAASVKQLHEPQVQKFKKLVVIK